MNCSGRSVAEPRRVIEIDEVLEARIAVLRITGHSWSKILLLDVFLLGRRLDGEVDVAEFDSGL